jgi:hypothetical protein
MPTAFLAALPTVVAPAPEPGPSIWDLTPNTGPIGTQVVLNGQHLEKTTSVTLDGKPVPGYTVLPSGLGISFTIREGASAGLLTVTTPYGSASLSIRFCVQYTATGTDVSSCGPQPFTLTAGGLPAGSTYAWYTQATGGTPIASSTQPSFYTGFQSRSTTFYVSLAPDAIWKCESPRTAIHVTINSAPANPTISSSTTASGVTLTSSAPTGNQWYLNGTAIAGATAPTYTIPSPKVGDAYTVTATSAAGCESVPSCPQYIAGGAGVSRCGPGPVTFTTAGLPTNGIGPNGDKLFYVWYTQPSGGSFLFKNTASTLYIYNVEASTTIYVGIMREGVYSNGNYLSECVGPLTAIPVTINDLPATPTISSTTASGVTLTSSAPTGNQWYFNGTAIDGATAPTLALSGRGVNGAYTVSTTSAAGCASAMSASQPIALATNAPAWLTQVQVHPNPTTGRFTLELPATASRPAQVRILNALGQVVHAQPASTSTLQLDLTHLARGVYAVQVQFENEPVIKRIVLH